MLIVTRRPCSVPQGPFHIKHLTSVVFGTQNFLWSQKPLKRKTRRKPESLKVLLNSGVAAGAIVQMPRKWKIFFTLHCVPLVAEQ